MVRSPLIPIFLTVTADVFGLTMMIPLLPFYAQKFGASPIVIGLLFASYAACQLISGPILGRISDRIGRKPTLLASQIGTLIGFLILGFSNALWLLFAARIIDGMTAGNLTIAQAYISDVTSPENRTRAFGMIGIAFGLGFLIGPAASGYLSTFGYHWPAFAAAGLSLLSIIFTITLLPNVRPTKASIEAMQSRLTQLGLFFRRPKTRTALLDFFLFTLSFSTLIGGLALYLQHQFGYDAQHTGYIYAFSGVVGLIVQGGLIGRLVRLLGEKRLATYGFVAMAVGYGALGYIFHLPLLLVGAAIGGFGSAVVRPSLTTLITKSVGPHEQGAALGVSQSLASTAQIVGPLLAGALIESENMVLYGVSAGIVALAGAIMLIRRTDDFSQDEIVAASK